MPEISYGGGTAAGFQVVTVTPAGEVMGMEYTLRLVLDDGDFREVSYTPTETDASDLIAGLVAVWNQQGDPVFTQILAVDGETDGNLTLTSKYAGVPFNLETEVETGGGTLTAEITTPNYGPNDVGVPENWSLGRLPIAGDDIVIPAGAPALLYNLWVLNVAPASFIQEEGHIAGMGREGFPVGGVAPRVALKVNPTTKCELRGGGPLDIVDLGAAVVAPLIYHTGTPRVNRSVALYLRGSAMTLVDVRKGKMRIESGNITDDLDLSGNSYVEIAAGVGISASHACRVMGSLAELRSWAELNDVVVYRDATYRQEEEVYTGDLTMQPGSKVYANAGGSYGPVIAFGGVLYSNETTLEKTFASQTENSDEFVHHLLPGLTTFTTPPVQNVQRVA